jgi:methyl-accepting chemotaxis protein
MKINNLQIGTRLGLGFGFVLFLLVGLALASMSSMELINNSLNKVIKENDVVIKELNDMRQAVMRVAVSVRNVSVMTDQADVTTEIKQIDAANEEYRRSADAITSMIVDNAGKALLAKIVEGEKATTVSVEKAIALAKRQGDVIPILLSGVVPYQRKWLDAMDEMIRYQEKQAQQTAAETSSAYDRARMITLSVAAVALLLGGFIAWYVTQSIVTPLHGALDIARRVAGGDLSTIVKVNSEDETGKLLAALRDMNASLLRIVGEVRSGTDTITTASSEIANGNANLSARTESQASSLQVTASSMEELTSTVKHNAENATQANRLAAAASDVALQGGAVVAQVIETMGAINESAKKIVDIIGVIDGIAFQTNILALNAAVEAARAGEQGRGFAVVASEVRGLAQRSAAAAKEIKALIGDSVEKVGIGAKLVDQAGTTMDEVVTSVRRVTDIISEIAAASQEQTAGIEQANQAIIQIDNVTQQNATLVEQAAAAAVSLQEQARNLSTVVSVFKIEASDRREVSDRPAPPQPIESHLRRNIVPSPGPSSRPTLLRTGAVKTLPAAVNSRGQGADWEEF